MNGRHAMFQLATVLKRYTSMTPFWLMTLVLDEVMVGSHMVINHHIQCPHLKSVSFEY